MKHRLYIPFLIPAVLLHFFHFMNVLTVSLKIMVTGMREETLISESTRVIFSESFTNPSLLFFLHFAACRVSALRMIERAFFPSMAVSPEKIVAYFNHVSLAFPVDSHQMPLAAPVLFQLSWTREQLVTDTATENLLVVK